MNPSKQVGWNCYYEFEILSSNPSIQAQPNCLCLTICLSNYYRDVANNFSPTPNIEPDKVMGIRFEQTGDDACSSLWWISIQGIAFIESFVLMNNWFSRMFGFDGTMNRVLTLTGCVWGSLWLCKRIRWLAMGKLQEDASCSERRNLHTDERISS